jgi:CheY-like chemotaxis protein
MKGDEEKASASGCDHYVTKPYSPVRLLRIIQVFLGEKVMEQVPALRVGQIEIAALDD